MAKKKKASEGLDFAITNMTSTLSMSRLMAKTMMVELRKHFESGKSYNDELEFE